MKKVLLGSTALVAAGLMAGPAFAQLELSISGSVDVHAGYASEDLDTGRSEYGITTDTTLNFDADGVADNGLEYGARINVDDVSEAGDDGGGGGSLFFIDETYVFMSGTFGEVRLGSTDPAASELRFTIPTVGNGQTDGDFQRYLADGGGAFGLDFAHSNDASKIVYIGTFGDVTVGASFTPSDDAAGDQSDQEEGTNDLRDVFSIGGNFQGEFNNVSVGVSAGANFGDVEGGGATAGGDHTEYGVGAEVGFGAITVGGFWIDSEREDTAGVNAVDRMRYGGGASFSTGPWSFAANFMIGEDDAGPGGADDIEDVVYGVGLEYALADGLTPYADLVFFDFDNPGTVDDNDGTVFLVGVTASF